MIGDKRVAVNGRKSITRIGTLELAAFRSSTGITGMTGFAEHRQTAASSTCPHPGILAFIHRATVSLHPVACYK